MLKKLNRVLFLVILACCAASFTACHTPAGRSAGEVVDDAGITTQIKASLLTEKILDGIAISVSTFEGNVTLTGAVKNSTQKQRATEIARLVKGVNKVNNLLQIK
jgi:hyperosmotically inducible protein